MAVVQMAPVRDGRGRFQPGCSGNPAGKRPGTLNHATLLKREMAEDDEGQFARQILDRARQGEWRALRFVWERLDPKPRQRPLEFDMPEGADRLEMMELLFRAMVEGEIAPDEALQVARLIDKLEAARTAAAAQEGDLHSACNSTSPVAEVGPAAQAPAHPSPTLRAGEGLKETVRREPDAQPQHETLPRAQHGGGQGVGLGLAEAPVPDDAHLNSACISTSPVAEAAPTAAPTQPSPMLRTGEGLKETVRRAPDAQPQHGGVECAEAPALDDAHLNSTSIFSMPGHDGPVQPRRPRRSRITYFDGSSGPAPAVGAP
jgi:Family of unknown function (DUF5681)